MNSIHSKFEKGKINKTFLRVDSQHDLDIFLGYNLDGQATMTILDFEKGKKIESSKFIGISIYKQHDNKISLSFILKDNEMYNIFLKFCEDIIESVRIVEHKKRNDFIVKRWNDWKNIFKDIQKKKLNENQIVGLLGELIFLNEYMIKKYGEEKAIKSWQGPEMLHKDFEVDSTWYEIKTKSTASQTIKISSIEQLDSDIVGNLAIIQIQKTNIVNEKSVNLNSYIKYIENCVSCCDLKKELINKLIKIGYLYDEVYNEFDYKFLSLTLYSVEDGFPRIKRNNLNNGITNCVYEIAISKIKDFEKREVDINEFTRV